jgi:hypothetical protein
LKLGLLTPKESSDLINAAFLLKEDSDCERFLAKVERILLDKMFQDSEKERLLGLTK